MVLDSFPTRHSQERESLILEAVRSGNAEYSFTSIGSNVKDYKAKFNVFSDALKIEGVRVNVTAETQQQIADEMGCLLMTARIADLRHNQASVKLKPNLRADPTGGSLMSTTEWMIWHSNKIDKQLELLGNPGGLIDTVGKHWIIDSSLNRPRISNGAINYGWHYSKSINLGGVPRDIPVSHKEMPNIVMIQSRGSHHDYRHSDYSQICVLVTRECEVNGKAMDLVDVLKDPELSYLANHSGPTAVWRQPGVKDPKIVFVIP